MRKNLILTSLVAIGLAYNANAATDVTFSGKYELSDGTQVNVSDALPSVSYEYTKSDGTTATVADQNTDPSLSDFTYTDREGNTANLSTGTPVQSDFWADTTADGVNVKTTQSIVSGATASRDNYTYLNGAGDEVTLGTSAQDMVETHTLSDYAGAASVTITNGTADTTFDGSLYSFELDNGNKFTLSADGTQLLDENGAVETPGPGTEMETKFNEAKAAYLADKTAVDTAISDTGTNWATEQVNFAAANTVFENDSAKITELDGFFTTVGTATNAYASAQANQQVAKDAYAENGVLLQDAKDVYDAPILETITNGANDAIDGALAENGAIRTELDKKVNMSDAQAIFAEKQQWVDNTLGIESANPDSVEVALTGQNAGDATTITGAINSLDSAVSSNTDAISAEVSRATAAEAELDGKITTNATNIAANKTAIETEVANRISADDAVLANAKAYADAQGTMSLQAAKDYTDVRFDELDQELSAGVASAVAMSSVAVSNVGKGELSVGGGYGYYNNQSAIAFGAAMGISDNWSVNAAAGLSDSNVTFRAGTNYKFKLF